MYLTNRQIKGTERRTLKPKDNVKYNENAALRYTVESKQNAESRNTTEFMEMPGPGIVRSQKKRLHEFKCTAESCEKVVSRESAVPKENTKAAKKMTSQLYVSAVLIIILQAIMSIQLAGELDGCQQERGGVRQHFHCLMAQKISKACHMS